ncbi:phage antirepressor Ant [Lactococcus garvieae]|uniref:ORF6C domain-containing protein n=1 Tax=Lactococcus formosensis TaxID=1281486 RepID=UPI0013FDE19A|nr:phage antirepressor Ant [Lactococcus garvieae]
MKQIENTLTSLEVADMVGKEHSKVIRDIRNIISHLTEAKNGFSTITNYFTEDTYKDSTGRELPCYRLTKKGCELFSTRMTGAKGTQFAVAYIERFNQMEQHVKQQLLPQTPEQQIALLAQGNVNLNKKVEQIENSVLDLTDRFGLPSNKAKVLQKKVASKVYMFTGGKASNAHKKIGSKVFREFYKDLNNRFDVVKYSDIPLSRYEEALEYLEMWQPAFNTTLEIRSLNAQTSFEF